MWCSGDRKGGWENDCPTSIVPTFQEPLGWVKVSRDIDALCGNAKADMDLAIGKLHEIVLRKGLYKKLSLPWNS